MKRVARGQEARDKPQEKNPVATAVVAVLGALTAALALAKSLMDLVSR